MLIDCPTCKKTNRVDPKKRSRCGNCKRDFTPRDLVKARVEPPPSRVGEGDEFELEQEDDDAGDEDDD